MSQAKQIIACVLLLLAANVAAAQELPRVLILGDSIYNELSRSAAGELKGRVDVVWKRPGDTSSALAQLDELLGEVAWDVIHFNFGLADLHYKDPNTKAIRAMSKYAGGVRVTSPVQYEKNLVVIVKRLQATGATLVWASTTPIAASKYDNLYDPRSEIEYNAIAAKIMSEHKIASNDMHAYVLEQFEGKKAADPFSIHRVVPLHPPIIRSILSALNVTTND